VDVVLGEESSANGLPGAPPSKRALSGTTTAARPSIFKAVAMCWTKLSCLFVVVTEKSGRL
jgi:hypothetical protein